ncbi:unnamed protein product [Echinostoma caproni]|uniref:Cadherin domain-containing protein n=1 Tax=Echinostoma caproni TaxID=27848 RepID=A0A183A9R8_9TREM|nr:unnamed protein product [Echinostoma caproni]
MFKFVFHLILLSSITRSGQSQYRDQHWRIQERTVEFNLDENSPIGTELGSVAAPVNGPKSISHPAGALTTVSELHYKLGAPSNLFAVNEQTGVLSTRSTIDAELLCLKAREQDVAEEYPGKS